MKYAVLDGAPVTAPFGRPLSAPSLPLRYAQGKAQGKARGDTPSGWFPPTAAQFLSPLSSLLSSASPIVTAP